MCSAFALSDARQSPLDLRPVVCRRDAVSSGPLALSGILGWCDVIGMRWLLAGFRGNVPFTVTLHSSRCPPVKAAGSA